MHYGLRCFSPQAGRSRPSAFKRRYRLRSLQPRAVASSRRVPLNSRIQARRACSSIAPGAAGARTATLILHDNAAGTPHSVSLSGTGMGTATVSVSTAAVDFGLAPVDGGTVVRTVTLTNTGSGPAAVGPAVTEGVTTTAGRLRTLGGGGNAVDGDGGPATAADLGEVFGVAVDGAGNVYLADATRHRVRRIDGVTGRITTVAGAGARGYSGDHGPATTASLNAPSGLAIDRTGALYIADTGNHVVRRVDSTGMITTIAGTGSAGYAGDSGPATAAALHAPMGIAVDRNGNLFVADSANHAIRRITADGTISTFAGDGTPGDGLGTDVFDPLRLNAPAAIALDAAGALYVADTGNHRLARIDPSGKTTWLVRSPSVSDPVVAAPSGLAVDAFGRVFIADTLRPAVRMLDPRQPPVFGYPIERSGVLATVTGTGLAGFADDTQAFPGQLALPRGLAVDVAGNIYIADAGNHRVRVVDAMTADTSTEFVSSHACPETLGPAATCAIDLTFDPAAIGLRTATLSVAGVTVELGGIGTRGIAYVGRSDTELLAADSPAWQAEVGSSSSRSLGLVNTGNGPLTLATVDVGAEGRGSFSRTVGCTTVLGAGDRCDIQVTFAPLTVSAASGTLHIAHDGLPGPLVLLLRANATRAATATTLTSGSPHHRSIFGEDVTLTVTVSSAHPMPTGVVVLRDGPQILGSSALAAGTASRTLSNLATGTHAFSAEYLGDSEHLPSVAALTYEVERQPTTTTLTASASDVAYGQPVTFTAVVVPSTNGTLAGRVRFQDGARVLGTQPLIGRTATLTVSDLTVAAHDVVAIYDDDPNAIASTSPAVGVAVRRASTTIDLQWSLNPAYPNYPVTLTATVNPAFGGLPTGIVTFRYSATTVDRPVVDGRASLVFEAPRIFTVDASYGGDGNFTGSSATSDRLTIQRAPATVTLTSSNNPSVFGENVTFTVTVTSPIGPPPDGQQVTLYNATVLPVQIMLTNGTGSRTVNFAAAGTSNVRAVYTGDATFGFGSAAVQQIVTRAPTTTSIVSSPNPSAPGQAVTLTIRVAASVGTPSGAVSIMIDGRRRGSVNLVNGLASISMTPSRTRGSFRIDATYSGAQNYEPSAATVTHEVR